MKIAQVFAHAIVRRLAYVLVAAALAWCGMGKAHAQAPPNRLDYGCQIADNGCSKATAAAQCSAFQSARDAYYKPAFVSYTSKCVDVPNTSLPGNGFYQFTQTNPTYESPFVYVPSECGAYGYDPDKPGECLTQQKCLTRPALGGAFTLGGDGTTCDRGCQMVPPLAVCDGTICSVSGAAPTGQACGLGKPPITNKDQQCTPAGSGQTYCVKKDGQQCYTAGSGRQVCWRPGETGEKPDNNVLQKRDAGTTPKAPNVNLPNGDTLTASGPPMKTTTALRDANGTRNITTVTQNYTTVNGTNAGTGNQGQNGDGTGAPGEGEGEGEGNEPGTPGEGVGAGLYEGSGKTVSSVMSNFMQQAQQSPLIGAAGQFMGNCTFGGACPNWSYDGGEMMGTVAFDLCNPALAGLYGFAGALVMALAAFCAFRIAIY